MWGSSKCGKDKGEDRERSKGRTGHPKRAVINHFALFKRTPFLSPFFFSFHIHSSLPFLCTHSHSTPLTNQKNSHTETDGHTHSLTSTTHIRTHTRTMASPLSVATQPSFSPAQVLVCLCFPQQTVREREPTMFLFPRTLAIAHKNTHFLTWTLLLVYLDTD